MATRIFDLPCLVFPIAVSNNEDWRDSWPYIDVLSNPIPLTGITLNFVLWSTAPASLAIRASTAVAVSGLPLNGRVAIGGASANVAGLNIPRSTMLRLAPGTQYLHETQAVADGVTKTIGRGPVSVLAGYNP